MKSKVFEFIKKEKKRQEETLSMIPSENYTYPEVLSAVGSIFISKYAENQPGSRYYQGMEHVDDLERYCESLALEVFGLSDKKWAVNVQAYSGTPANLAVFNAFLDPGDRIMAMFLPDGGHLSHGWEYKGNKITFTSKIYNISFYHVDQKTKVLDYEQIKKAAKKIKPKIIVSGGTAYPREINHAKMGNIAKSVGAYYLADISHEAGLVAGKVNKSPFSYADAVTMTTHKTLRGPRGALVFVRSEFGEVLDRSIFPGIQGGPHMHTIAGIAVTLEKAKTANFKKYAKQVVENAKRLADNLKKDGFEVVSGGTQKHLVLVDLRNKKVNGWFAAWALEVSGIIVNRNTVPYDTGSPYYPSGIRLGTPGITARGMKAKEMDKISDWISQVVEHLDERHVPDEKEKRGKVLKDFKVDIKNDNFYKKIREDVRELCIKYPISN